MNPYDITVIFAAHDDSETAADFPAQTLPAQNFELIRVQEDDLLFPHRASLEAARQAQGTYTIIVDAKDTFPEDMLEKLSDAMKKSGAPFAMPAFSYQNIDRAHEYFALQKREDVPFDLSLDYYESAADRFAFYIKNGDETIAVGHNGPDDSITFDKKIKITLEGADGPTDLNLSLEKLVPEYGNVPGRPAADRFLFPADLNGLMLRTDLLKPLLTDAAASADPEKMILLELLRQNPVFFWVGTCSYQYANARECDFQYDQRCFYRDWYYLPLTDFLLPLLKRTQEEQGQIPVFLQELALYMIHCRWNANIDNRNKHALEPEDVPGYEKLLEDILQFVESRVILANACAVAKATPTTQLTEIRMKHRDFSYYPAITCEKNRFTLTCDGQFFSRMDGVPVRINLMNYENGCLEIDGGIADFFSLEDVTVYATLGGKRYPLTYNKRYSMTKCFGVTYARMKTFHVSVPVPPPTKEHVLSFLYCVKGHEYIADLSFPSHTSRLARNFTYSYWKFGEYFSYWKPDGIHIIKSGKLKTCYKEFRLWLQILKTPGFRSLLPRKVLNFLLRPYFSRQKIWLFFDKIYKGGDSSEYIYRYACKQNDGIKKYYLLDKNAPDYKRLRAEGYHPLKRGSIKHRLIFLNADLVIASNSTVFAFNDYNFHHTLPFRGDFHFDVACVQHGMSIQKIALAQQRLRDNTRLYFCASKYEIENLSKPVYDYEGYDALKLTGVPRYDGLEDRKQKILLFSPTWRMNSARPVTKNEGVARDYNPNFKDTNYFKVYNSLMNDPRLLEAAKKYGYRIQYVLHPIVSPQAEDFTKNEFVEIIPATGDMSYEKIFCESALMVTDFSGVQFDFAYMRKPVVYLHHNDIPQHYENGTVYYDTMGFGEICHTNDELIDVLCEYMKNDCEMPKLYRDRADDFFYYSDHHNCERIYPEMLAYTNNKKH